MLPRVGKRGESPLKRSRTINNHHSAMVYGVTHNFSREASYGGYTLYSIGDCSSAFACVDEVIDYRRHQSSDNVAEFLNLELSGVTNAEHS